MGEEVFLTVIFTAVYWCFSKKLGEYMGYSLFTSLCINGIIKDTFKFKRPIGEKGILTIREETATGYSFPSGHTQTTSTFYSSIYFFTKSKIILAIGIVITTLVGFSRLYLGVHYPKDVVFGIIIGVLVSFICGELYLKFSKKNALTKLYFWTCVVTIALLFYAPSDDYLKSVALFTGFTASVYIERKYINFSTDIPIIKKVTRWILGIIVVGGTLFLLNEAMPDTRLCDFIKYSSICFMGIAVYPFIFTKYENYRKGK